MATLKDRQRTQGDTALVAQSNMMLQRVDAIEAKLDALLRHLNVAPPPPQLVQQPPFAAQTQYGAYGVPPPHQGMR